MTTGAFTMEEYQEVKRKFKTGKLPGGDGKTSEVLKFCDLDTTKWRKTTTVV